jgi:hypothetical protein
VNDRRGESSNWPSLEDVFQRWRARLGLSEDAKDKLYALLCDRESRSAKRRSGEVTLDILHAEFWRDEARLEVDTDVDGADHLRVDYPDYVHVFEDKEGLIVSGPAEFLVRAVDVERWERLYLPTTESRPRAAKGPVRGEIDRFGDATARCFRRSSGS